MNFFVYLLIGLAKDMSPLAVAEDHVPAAEVAEHRGGDFARERPLWLVVHVLRAEGDFQPAIARPTASR